MCQPKPGPRCAAHARAPLAGLKAANEQAQAAVAVFDEQMNALMWKERTALAGTPEYRSAWAKYRDTSAAYDTALREYETTPEGQRALTTAVETLRGEGDEAGAAAAEKRLTEAKATREQQVADLAAARAITARLADTTPAEQAALAQADHAVAQAQATTDAAVTQHTVATNAAADYAGTYDAAVAEHDAAWRATLAARQAVAPLELPVRGELSRLYHAAGIPPGLSTYFVEDSVGYARRGCPPGLGPDVAMGPIPVKVKQAGKQWHAETKAAREAAKTDERFQRANTALAQAAAAYKTAADNEQQVTARLRPAMDEQHRRARAVEQAQMAVTDAQTRHAQAAGQASMLRAQIGSGAGVQATPVNLREVRNEIVRQPDGSTNAYVYRSPSDGFPDGRYHRVVGVTSAVSMTPANALVLDNGEKVHAAEHTYRNHRGMQNDKSGHGTRVIITAAQGGAHPLNEEGTAGAGYSSFIDSTD